MIARLHPTAGNLPIPLVIPQTPLHGAVVVSEARPRQQQAGVRTPAFGATR
jgi:hypothetical protein